MHTFPTEAAVGAQLARDGLQPIFHKPEEHGSAAPLVTFPKSEKIITLESFLPRPVRKRASVTVRDHDSFIDYVKLHQEPGTLIMADLDPTGASFTAILDYHLSNVDPKAPDFKPGLAGWGNHQCKLMLQHTPEWQAWDKMDEELMGQAEFAQFLEANRLDIVDPDAATVLEIAKSIEATTGATFKSAIREQSGDRTLKFETNTTAIAGVDGKLTIPEKLKLKLPVFINGPEFELEVFFRYRPTAAGVKLFYSRIRPHKVMELAVLASREAIEAALQAQVHNGTATVLGC